MRPSARQNNQLRKVSFEVNVNRYAEGSCLIKMGNTHVLCTASIENGRPTWKRQQGLGGGWVTADYAMLPRATHVRRGRDSNKTDFRAVEIKRLVGRALRSVVDLDVLGERQIFIDCDVLQADGGTRCASITGGFVAMYLACEKLVKCGEMRKNPITHFLAAISVGVHNGNVVIDLDYDEDCHAEVDANFVVADGGALVEVQATGESKPFTGEQMDAMLKLAKDGVAALINLQKQVVEG